MIKELVRRRANVTWAWTNVQRRMLLMCYAPALPHCGSWRVVEDADPSVDVGRNPLGLARAWRGSASRHRKKPAERAGVIHPRSGPANAGDRGLRTSQVRGLRPQVAGWPTLVVRLGGIQRDRLGGVAEHSAAGTTVDAAALPSRSALPPTTKFCHPLLGSLFWTVRGVRPNDPPTSRRSAVHICLYGQAPASQMPWRNARPVLSDGPGEI